MAIIAVAALGSGAQAAGADATDAPDPREDAFVAWRPVDGDSSAGLSAVQEFGQEELGDCTSGAFRDWTLPAGGAAELFWMNCGSPDAAAARVRAEWTDDFALFPAPDVAAALDGDSELTARFTGDDGETALLRMWAQGEYAIGVKRTCPQGDLGCQDASARDVRSVASISPGAPSPIPPVEPDAKDPLRGFSPSDEDGPWTLRYSKPADSTVVGGDARCGEGRGTQFVNPSGDVVGLWWVDCPTLERAQELAADYWRTVQNEGLSFVYGSGWDGVTRIEAGSQSRIARWWIQGQRYLQIDQTCADGDESRCATRTAAYLQTIAGSMPTTVQPLTDWNKALSALVILLGVPIATYLVILIPRRVVARRRQRELPPASETDATLPFIPVDRLVRRTRTGRTVRRLIIVVLGTIASLAVVWAGLFSQQFVLQLFALFLGPFLVFFAIAGILDLIWRPHRLVRPPRRRGRPSLRGAAGLLLRGVALIVAISMPVLYLLAVLFMWYYGQQSDAAFRAETAQALAQADGTGMLLPYALLGLHELQQSGWIVALFFGMVAIPIFLAYLVDRVGRRLARSSLHETLARDDRPHFLYLRAFDEDGLRIDESLGRRGFLEIFSPFGRPRFEEVLAEQLSAWGPVIAISGTKRAMQDLGAAKISFEGEEWRDHVRSWIGGARAVVLSATPSQVREGLDWEITQLATSEGAPPIVLVIAPWPRAERQRRWDAFLASATRWATFRTLLERPAPSATHIITYSGSRGWTAYGARRRWDWSYAASLLTAIERGDLEPSPGAAESIDAPSPAEREPEHA